MTERTSGSGRAGARPCAPQEIRYCLRGHRKTRDKPTGAWRCRECQRQHHLKAYERKRQKRLAAREARIAGRTVPPRSECLWAAGHFEGEGTFTIVSRGPENFPRPHVCLTSTDRTMVDVFQRHWPGHVRAFIPKSLRGVARRAYRWNLNNHEGIECFVLDILPFLKSERVRAKAELLLEDIRDRVQQRRTPEERARKRARHVRMKELNRRGVERDAVEAAQYVRKG